MLAGWFDSVLGKVLLCDAEKPLNQMQKAIKSKQKKNADNLNFRSQAAYTKTAFFGRKSSHAFLIEKFYWICSLNSLATSKNVGHQPEPIFSR